MKPPLLAAAIGFLVVALAWASLRVAHADDAGACYAVGDPDARAYCLAKAHREPGRCYSIQRQDLRARCLAEVRG